MVRRHYRLVAEQLSLRKAHLLLNKYSSIRAVVPISGVHRGMIDAVRFAETIASKVVAVYIEIDPGSAEDIRCRWDNWFPHLPLVVSESPYRSIVRPFLEFLDRTDQGMKDSELMVVVLPEFLPAHPWQAFLHNRTSNLIKKALLNRKRKFGYTRVIIDVPFHLVE